MKHIKKFAYKTPQGVVESPFHNLNADLTSLREEVARLQALENRLEVKVVKILPETLEDNVLYVVSDENVADIKDILARLGSHDVDIQVINSDITGIADDISAYKTEVQGKFDNIDGRIDETSQVIGLKTTELNTKLDEMSADIEVFKEKMKEQKTDFTANIVQLQDLTAKHTTDIKTNADNITALQTDLADHKTSNDTEIARLDAKDASQDATIAELTGKGTGLSILDLKDTVQQNADNISNHETRITTLETTVSSNKETQDAYNSTNDTRIKALEDLETEHNTAVNTSISNLDAKVDTNRTEFLNTMENVDATLTDHDTRITQNAADITKLNDDLISTNAETIKNLEEKIDTGLTAEADIRSKTDTNLQDSVNEINTTDKEQNSRIKALEEYTSNDFTTEINALKERASSLESADVSLENKIRAIQQFSANHDSRLENLEHNDRTQFGVRITALENTTANQKDRLDGIDTLNTEQNDRLTSIENLNIDQGNDLINHDERITELETHRDNLEEEQKAIVREELDTKLADLESNYHDEMIAKVSSMTDTRLSEINAEVTEFNNTVTTKLETIEGIENSILETQTEQQEFLDTKTQSLAEEQLRQDQKNQSYYEKFLDADEYNKTLAEKLDDNLVTLYSENPNYTEEIVYTRTLSEDEIDPNNPDVTTKEETKQVEHTQLTNSVALYEIESPSGTEQTEFDLSEIQGRITALENTKNDYIQALAELEEKVSSVDNKDAEIEDLGNRLESVKSQVQGVGSLHAQTVERVNNLEAYTVNDTKKFDNYKQAQTEINDRQDNDLLDIHDHIDDLAENYDKIQGQTQDDILVLRKVIDTPKTEETEEESHLEIDSTEIIKVDDLVDTKEELLRVRDLPVEGYPVTYLRGIVSEHLYGTAVALTSQGEDPFVYTKEKYYNFNLNVENAGKIVVASSDDLRQRMEIRKETVVVTTPAVPAVLDAEGNVVTEEIPETSENVLKYFLYYVQTDEYINEEDNTTYTEDTEIKISEINPTDYVESQIADQSRVSDYFIGDTGETWIKFNTNETDGVGGASFNGSAGDFQFNNFEIYVGSGYSKLIYDGLESMTTASDNINTTICRMKFHIENSDEVVHLTCHDTGGNLRVSNNRYNYMAFDGNSSTYWGNYWSSAGPGIAIMFDRPINITKISYTSGSYYNNLTIKVNNKIYYKVDGNVAGNRTFDLLSDYRVG